MFDNIPDIAKVNLSEHAYPLDKVGMSDIEVPLRLETPFSNDPIFCLAKADAFLSLDDPHKKGVHMSRLYIELQQTLAQETFSFKLMHKLLQKFINSHQDISHSAYLNLEFHYPLLRKALKSSHQGWRGYPVSFQGSLEHDHLQFFVKLQISYSSTCPCSAALARQVIQHEFIHDFANQDLVPVKKVVEWLGSPKGTAATAHGQRSHANITLKIDPDKLQKFSLIQIIDGIENTLQTPVQTAVKRIDEQEFARRNGHQLMFAEDAARRVKNYLLSCSEIEDFEVEAIHFESLHAHNAVAIASKGK